jgi:hypothetical protein
MSRQLAEALNPLEDAAPAQSMAQAARAKLHQEIDELLTEFAVEQEPTFAGIRIEVTCQDEPVRKLHGIRLIIVDQDEHGTLSTRVGH